MRIIGGRWKRSLLPVLETEGLRPTPDRVRETLFNWLGQDLSGLTCLDLFAETDTKATFFTLGWIAERHAAGATMVSTYPVPPLLPRQALAIGVTRSDRPVAQFRFESFWKGQ